MKRLFLAVILALATAVGVFGADFGREPEILKCVKCYPCEGRGPKAVKCSPEELLPYFKYRSCIKIVNNDTTTNPSGVVVVERRCSTRLPNTGSSCIMNAYGNTPGVLQCKYFCGYDGCNAGSLLLVTINNKLLILLATVLPFVYLRWNCS